MGKIVLFLRTNLPQSKSLAERDTLLTVNRVATTSVEVLMRICRLGCRSVTKHSSLIDTTVSRNVTDNQDHSEVNLMV